MSDDDNDNAAELMSTYKTLYEALMDALERRDDGKIFNCGEKYVRFLTANEHRLGIDVSAEVNSALKRIEPFSAAAQKMKATRIDAQQRLETEMQKFGENFLWRRSREINGTPLLLRGTAQHRKALQELALACEVYAQYFNVMPVESTLRHFRARLDFDKKMRANGERFALTADKIAILAKALDDFQNIYEAEQAEQTGRRELVLAAHEARRIRKLFDEIDRSDLPPVVRGGN